MQDWHNPVYENWILLLIYASSLVIHVGFHTWRRCNHLVKKKSSVSLAWLFLIKSLLLLIDLLVQGLFLYSILVHFSAFVFNVSGSAIPIALSVIIISPIVSTCSNSLINLPLHYW